MPLRVGDSAPSFTLVDGDRKSHTLESLLSSKLVIATIPGAFTSVCTEEICTFRDSYADFEALGASVVILAVDSPFVNKAYAEANQIRFPILSDYTRSTIAAYGGLHKDFAGLSGYDAPKRSVFILDQQAKVIFAWISENPGELPPFSEIRKALE